MARDMFHVTQRLRSRIPAGNCCFEPLNQSNRMDTKLYELHEPLTAPLRLARPWPRECFLEPCSDRATAPQAAVGER
jgi:hypothetical protein